MKLSSEQIAGFDELGYLFLPNVFSAADAESEQIRRWRGAANRGEVR